MALRLKGKSSKGKNRICEHGDLWEVTKTENTVDFSDKKGPWHFLRSVKTGYGKWFHNSDDLDFERV
jgi:hypothetical protein